MMILLSTSPFVSPSFFSFFAKSLCRGAKTRHAYPRFRMSSLCQGFGGADILVVDSTTDRPTVGGNVCINNTPPQ